MDDRSTARVDEWLEKLSQGYTFYYSELVRIDGLDGAIIGIDYDYERLIYDQKLMKKIFIIRDGLDEDAAEDQLRHYAINYIELPYGPIFANLM